MINKGCQTNTIDGILNGTIKIISRTLKTTSVSWLDVLSDIYPLNVRRILATLRKRNKIDCSINTRDLFIHEVIKLSSKSKYRKL